MAVRLTRGTYYHIPKTGGIFLCAVLDRIPGLVASFSGLRHDYANSGFPGFSFVREPTSWLKSYWRYRYAAEVTGTGWRPFYAQAESHPTHVFDRCGSTDPLEFIDKVTKQAPGEVTRLFRRFESLRVCKYEYLKDEFISALRFFGHTNIDFDHAFNIPNQNISQGPDFEIPGSLIDQVKVAERIAYERYGYA